MSDEYIKEDAYSYFDFLPQDKSIEFIKTLEEKTTEKTMFMKTIFPVMVQGIKESKMKLAVCNASTMRAFLKQMTSSFLMPLAGFEAVSKIINDLMDEPHALHIGGVFMPERNTIYVVVDDASEARMDDWSLTVVYHEMCHYYAHNNPKEFIRKFYEPILYPVYFTLFKKMSILADIKIDDELLQRFTRTFVVNIFPLEALPANNRMLNKGLKSAASKLKDIHPQLTGAWWGLMNDSYSNQKYIDATSELVYKSYIEAGIQIPKYFRHYQELLWPSEVVAVISSIKRDDPLYLGMISNIFN